MNLPVSLPAFAVFRTSQLPAKWDPPLATVTSVAPRRNLDRFSVVWPVTTERTGHQTATIHQIPAFQTVQSIVAKPVERSELGSRDVWAKGEESFLAKWQQQREQGRRSRVASRVSPRRRTVRPRRNLSFVCTRTESFVHLVLGRLVYRPPKAPDVGQEVSRLDRCKGKGAPGGRKGDGG